MVRSVSGTIRMPPPEMDSFEEDKWMQRVETVNQEKAKLTRELSFANHKYDHAMTEAQTWKNKVLIFRIRFRKLTSELSQQLKELNEEISEKDTQLKKYIFCPFLLFLIIVTYFLLAKCIISPLNFTQLTFNNSQLSLFSI